MFFFETCFNKVKELFPENWLKNYENQQENEGDKSESLLNIGVFIGYLRVCQKDFFYYINLSVISGEYISHFEQIKKLLNDFYALLEKVEQEIMDWDGNSITVELNMSKSQSFSHQYSTFQKFLSIALTDYAQFINEIDIKLNHPMDVLFINSTQSFDFPNDFLFKIYKDNIWFKINIRLAQIDNSITVKEKLIKELILINEGIVGFEKETHIQKILLDKCNFLLKKFKSRFDNEDNNFVYFSGKTYKPINIDEIELEVLKEPYKESMALKAEKSDLRTFIDKVGKKKNPFKYYRLKIKYLKKYDKDALDSFIAKKCGEDGEIKKRIKTEEKKFDLRACRVGINFLKNNELSYILKHTPNIGIYDLNHYYINYKDFQQENEVNNYYPFLQLAKKYSEVIENLFVNGNNDIKDLDESIKRFEKCLETLEKKYKWCYEHDFLPYQLPFNECIYEVDLTVDDTDKKIPVFLASSFILPVNYENVRKGIEKLRNDLNGYKQTLILNKSIQVTKKGFEQDIEIVNENINKAREDTKDVQKNNIEVLSIFAAFAVFALGNVQLFTKIETLRGALAFMLVFAYSLTLFALLIWVVTNYHRMKIVYVNNTKDWLKQIVSVIPRTHVTIIILLFIGLVASIYILIFADTMVVNKSNVKEEPEKNKNCIQINDEHQLPVNIVDSSKITIRSTINN